MFSPYKRHHVNLLLIMRRLSDVNNGRVWPICQIPLQNPLPDAKIPLPVDTAKSQTSY
jgi:hypothetical protein